MSVTQRTRMRAGRKKTVYEAAVYVRGVRVASETFDTRAAAHTWHDETKKKAEAGQLHSGGSKTFLEIVLHYRMDAFIHLGKSTRQAREPRFRYLTESPLAEIRMEHFTEKAIDEWLRWLRNQPTAHDPQRKTFYEELRLLSVVLQFYRNEYDPRFVVPIVRRHRKTAKHFKPVEARRKDYFMRSKDVVEWLRELRKRPDPVYHRLGFLMVLTGLRMGEAAGLCWDAVNLDGHGQASISVTRVLCWDHKTKQPYFKDAPKTEESVRTIPIEGALADMLLKMKAAAGSVIGPVPVFRPAKGGLLRDNSIRQNFNKAFEACGLSWTGTRITRHTFASLALMAEKDIAPVQAAMGHTSQRVTERYAKIVALQDGRISGKVMDFIGITAGASR